MSLRVPFYYHLASESDWSEDLAADERAAPTADDRPLDDRPEIVVEFRYPLRAPILRTLVSDGPFTRRAFALAVAHEYAKIYDGPDEADRVEVPEPPKEGEEAA